MKTTKRSTGHTHLRARRPLRAMAAITLTAIGASCAPVDGQWEEEMDTQVGELTGAPSDPSMVANNAVVSIAANPNAPHCTGVLVSPRLVLTAGHCLNGTNLPGDSGLWDSRTPTWRTYNMPDATPNPGWTSGYKGNAIRYVDRIITDFNYTTATLATAAACQAACEGVTRCGAWTWQASTQRCFFKEPKFRVNFGPSHASPLGTATSSRYSIPGYADIAIMELDAPVAATVATPALVMSHLFDSEAEVRAFLSAQSYRAVGFSPANPTRRAVAMSYGEYPLRSDLVMLRAAGAGGSTVESGDSGSPLFMQRRGADGVTRSYVAGICQGTEAGGGRYTLTGINLRRAGSLLTFPYDPAGVDRRAAAPIGEWLNNVLYAESRAASDRLPVYNWFSPSRGDNFFTSDPRWTSDPRGVAPDVSGVRLDPPREQEADARMFRLEGYVFPPRQAQPAGTLPLWSWHSGAREDNFVSTDPRWSTNPATVTWNGEHIVGGMTQDGYTQYRLEGYVYDPRRPQPANTVPLYSWFHPGRGDNFATTDPGWSIPVSSVRWSGERITNGTTRDGYTIYRLEGFVPAAPR